MPRELIIVSSSGRSVITRSVDRYKRDDSRILDVTLNSYIAMSSYWHRQISGTHRVAKAIYNPFIIISIVLLIFFGAPSSSIANPLPIYQPPISLPPEFNQSATTVESLLYNNTSNATTNDLYVIRAVVYEIGILTDVDNSTNATTDRHEEVNLSFYDPPHHENGLLDLSGIPVPQVFAATTNSEK